MQLEDGLGAIGDGIETGQPVQQLGAQLGGEAGGGFADEDAQVGADSERPELGGRQRLDPPVTVLSPRYARPPVLPVGKVRPAESPSV